MLWARIRETAKMITISIIFTWLVYLWMHMMVCAEACVGGLEP